MYHKMDLTSKLKHDIKKIININLKIILNQI